LRGPICGRGGGKFKEGIHETKNTKTKNGGVFVVNDDEKKKHQSGNGCTMRIFEANARRTPQHETTIKNKAENKKKNHQRFFGT